MGRAQKYINAVGSGPNDRGVKEWKKVNDFKLLLVVWYTVGVYLF